MMRLILMAVLSLPIIAYPQADKKLAVFGKIDKADLELKTCDFDPDAEAIVLSDYGLTVTRMVAASGNILNTKIIIEYKRPYYSPDEYPDLKEFYKKMFALIDEQIVIKKKNS